MLHVTFGRSAHGSLAMAFDELDRFVSLADDMSIGPLGTSTTERMEACAAMIDDEWGPAEEVDEFWSEVIAAPAITVWMGRRCATEHVAWLELVRRRDAPIWLIDMVDFEAECDHPVEGFAITPQRTIIGRRLWDRARLLDEPRRATARAVWERLRDENAPIRVVENDEVRSVPITHFDGILVAEASDEWKPLMNIVGYAMARGVDDRTRPQLSGDKLGIARVFALVDQGVLELEPDRDPSRHPRVRRAR